MIVTNFSNLRISIFSFILFFCLANFPVVAEQPFSTAPEPPDVKILDFGLIAVPKEPAKNVSQSPLTRTVPSRNPNELGPSSAATKDRLGKTDPQSQGPDDWESAVENAGASGPDHYEIHITVKNTGTNTVKTIDWQYTFMDAEGEKEVKHFRIRGKKKIPPNGMAILTKSFLPVLFTSEDPKPDFAKGKQKVAILRVIYDDDSSWESRTATKPKN